MSPLSSCSKKERRTKKWRASVERRGPTPKGSPQSIPFLPVRPDTLAPHAHPLHTQNHGRRHHRRRPPARPSGPPAAAGPGEVAMGRWGGGARQCGGCHPALLSIGVGAGDGKLAGSGRPRSPPGRGARPSAKAARVAGRGSGRRPPRRFSLARRATFFNAHSQAAAPVQVRRFGLGERGGGGTPAPARLSQLRRRWCQRLMPWSCRAHGGRRKNEHGAPRGSW